MKELDNLIQAVQAGKLEIRGDAEAFSGSWCDLVVGINSVIEAFVKPISTTATYIDRVSQGDIPDTITETYQGDFDAIKQNLREDIAVIEMECDVNAPAFSRAAAETLLANMASQ